MRIAFLLPNYSGHVVGSLKVAYRFAGIAAKAGHEVDVFHPAIDNDQRSLRFRLRARFWALRKSAMSRPVPWHEFEDGVRPIFLPSLSRMRPRHDAAVAFTWRSVEVLARMRGPRRRFGYIVEYETWASAAAPLRGRMERAYLSGIPLLCSSDVVEGMLRGIGAMDVRPAHHGVEVDAMRSSIPPASRDPGRIGFPVRTESVKAPEVLRETVELLRASGRTSTIWGFGRGGPPRRLSDLFDEFHQDPSDEELAALYGRSAVFAIPSHLEGFGMPAAEAMAAGCAVVSTDNGGIRTYGIPDRNCLIVPPGSAAGLAAAILGLLDDPGRRISLGEAGPDSILPLRWEAAAERFLASIAAQA